MKKFLQIILLFILSLMVFSACETSEDLDIYSEQDNSIETQEQDFQALPDKVEDVWEPKILNLITGESRSFLPEGYEVLDKWIYESLDDFIFLQKGNDLFFYQVSTGELKTISNGKSEFLKEEENIKILSSITEKDQFLVEIFEYISDDGMSQIAPTKIIRTYFFDATKNVLIESDKNFDTFCLTYDSRNKRFFYWSCGKGSPHLPLSVKEFDQKRFETILSRSDFSSDGTNRLRYDSIHYKNGFLFSMPEEKDKIVIIDPTEKEIEKVIYTFSPKVQSEIEDFSYLSPVGFSKENNTLLSIGGGPKNDLHYFIFFRTSGDQIIESKIIPFSKVLSFWDPSFMIGDVLYYQFYKNNPIYAFDLKTWEMKKAFEKPDEDIFLFEKPELDEGNFSLPPYFHHAEVSYHQEPIKLTISVFDERQNRDVFNKFGQTVGWKVSYEDGGWDYLSPLLQWHKAGMIQKAPYEGWDLLVLRVACGQSSCLTNKTNFDHSGLGVYRFAYNPQSQKIVYLPRNSISDTWAIQWLSPYLQNADQIFELIGINLPKRVYIPGKNAHLTFKEVFPGNEPLFDVLEIFFETEALGTFYLWERAKDWLFYIHPDGTWLLYQYEPDTQSLITWKDGGQTDLSQEYGFNREDCKFDLDCNKLYFSIKKAELEEVAQTPSGFAFYEVKDPVELTQQEMKNYSKREVNANLLLNKRFVYFTDSYNQIRAEGGREPLNFQEFLALYPMLFWEDPFGRIGFIIHNNFHDPV